MLVGGWWLVGGGWLVVVGCWLLVGGGWLVLVVGGWWWLVGFRGWWLVVVGWWLVVGWLVLGAWWGCQGVHRQGAFCSAPSTPPTTQITPAQLRRPSDPRAYIRTLGEQQVMHLPRKSHRHRGGDRWHFVGGNWLHLVRGNWLVTIMGGKRKAGGGGGRSGSNTKNINPTRQCGEKDIVKGLRFKVLDASLSVSLSSSSLSITLEAYVLDRQQSKAIFSLFISLSGPITLAGHTLSS